MQSQGRYGITMKENEIEQLMHHIEATIDLSEGAKGIAQYWTSLPLSVIDSVWSLGSKHESQVVPLITRFCHSHTPHWAGTTASKPTSDVKPTLREFVDIIGHRLRTGHSYETLFGNRQRTSSRNGILKAEAVHEFALSLLASGINNFSDLRDSSKIEEAETRVKEIPGQRSGLSFKYFLMITGEDDYVKPDTQIRRYVSDALGVEWTRLVSEEKAEELVKEAARRFANDYHGLTPAGLDNAIWAYQHKRTRPFRVIRPGSGALHFHGFGKQE
jgi:hypothetical protein